MSWLAVVLLSALIGAIVGWLTVRALMGTLPYGGLEDHVLPSRGLPPFPINYARLMYPRGTSDGDIMRDVLAGGRIVSMPGDTHIVDGRN